MKYVKQNRAYSLEKKHGYTEMNIMRFTEKEIKNLDFAQMA